MATARSIAQPAFVLHQWDWSETSLILDLFTRDRGRLAVVAKGAKRPYSQLRPVLMPFQRLLVLTSKPRAEEGADILTLRSADYAGTGAVLPTARLFAGFYLNELLMKLLARNDAHELLFDAYADTLLALAQPEGADHESPLRGDHEAALRAFELVLLRETGVLPELGRNTITQALVQPGRAYALKPEQGLVPGRADDGGNGEGNGGSSDGGRIDGAAWLALQQSLDRHDLAALRSAAAADLPALKAQLRNLLAYHLASSPLRTRQMVVQVRRLLGDPALN